MYTHVYVYIRKRSCVCIMFVEPSRQAQIHTNIRRCSLWTPLQTNKRMTKLTQSKKKNQKSTKTRKQNAKTSAFPTQCCITSYIYTYIYIYIYTYMKFQHPSDSKIMYMHIIHASVHVYIRITSVCLVPHRPVNTVLLTKLCRTHGIHNRGVSHRDIGYPV